MRATILLSTALAALTAAAPQKRAASSKADVVVIGTTAGISNPNGAPVDIPVHIAHLAHSDASITKLQVKPGSGTGGINANDVECRMYKDKHGTVPGSLPFNTTTVANVSTNLVEIGSILCYVVGQDE